MNKENKEALVKELIEKYSNAKSIILTDFCGLDAIEISELRKKLRDANIEYIVVKNRLLKRVNVSCKLENMDTYLDGPTAVAICNTDSIYSAKVLKDFKKAHENLKIKGGLIEEKVFEGKQIEEIADIPSREVLLSIVIAGVQSPLHGLVNALNGIMQKLVIVLEEIKKKK